MLADAAIETHDRILGRLYRQAERRRDEMLQGERSDTATILRGFVAAGGALVAARLMGNDLEAAGETSTTWTAFERLVRDAARLTERVSRPTRSTSWPRSTPGCAATRRASSPVSAFALRRRRSRS